MSVVTELLGYNPKFRLLLRNTVLGHRFYEIVVLVVTNWSTRLEKHQSIEILLKVHFYAFLKILHFLDFLRFF